MSNTETGKAIPSNEMLNFVKIDENTRSASNVLICFVSNNHLAAKILTYLSLNSCVEIGDYWQENHDGYNYILKDGLHLSEAYKPAFLAPIPQDSMFTKIESDDLSKIDHSVIGKPVLFKFENGEIVGGMFYNEEDLGVYYGLWDGDVLVENPIGYIVLPEVNLQN